MTDTSISSASESLAVDIECGDVVLFSRPCLSMDPLSASICLAAKIFTSTPNFGGPALPSWDHVGIVVEDVDDPQRKLYLLEANVTGVARRPLIDRLQTSKSSAIAIRKVISLDTLKNSGKTESWKQKLWKASNELVNKPYNASTIHFTKALVSSYSSHNLSDTLSDAYRQALSQSTISKPRDTLLNDTTTLPHRNSHESTSLLGKLLHHYHDTHSHHHRLHRNLHLNPKDHHHYLPINYELSDEYFCSHLVADVLRLGGVIDDQRDASLYIPADFSSSCILHPLRRNTHSHWHFSPDLVINAPKQTVMSEHVYTNNSKLTILETETSRMPRILHFSRGDILPASMLSQFQRIYQLSAANTIGATSDAKWSYDNKKIVSETNHHKSVHRRPRFHLNVEDKTNSKTPTFHAVEEYHIGDKLDTPIPISSRYNETDVSIHLLAKRRSSIRLETLSNNSVHNDLNVQTIELGHYPAILNLFNRFSRSLSFEGFNTYQQSSFSKLSGIDIRLNKGMSLSVDMRDGSNLFRDYVVFLVEGAITYPLISSNLYSRRIPVITTNDSRDIPSPDFNLNQISQKSIRILNPEAMIGITNSMNDMDAPITSQDCRIIAFPKLSLISHGACMSTMQWERLKSWLFPNSSPSESSPSDSENQVIDSKKGMDVDLYTFIRGISMKKLFGPSEEEIYMEMAMKIGEWSESDRDKAIVLILGSTLFRQDPNTHPMLSSLPLKEYLASSLLNPIRPTTDDDFDHRNLSVLQMFRGQLSDASFESIHSDLYQNTYFDLLDNPVPSNHDKFESQPSGPLKTTSLVLLGVTLGTVTVNAYSVYSYYKSRYPPNNYPPGPANAYRSSMMRRLFSSLLSRFK